jgi:serine/threonine protein kinase/tetratricopeptide (TPR) repeat protein
MAHTTSERVKQIFGEAHEIPPSERARFLDGACGGDPRLRAEVDGLLAALDSASEFLVSKDGSGGLSPEAAYPSATLEVTAKERQSLQGPGTVIGRYRLLQEIGHGGFGTVFLAEQREPVRRKVALKIVKAGMDTREVLTRFEAERQALALMDHPGVAKVFDAGATESGRPYFVMEYVAGLPINEHCDTTHLKISERMALFIEVCQVVQHAHQKGIIHRDLKPSNILVTVGDGKPAPKVIDFGIAKATIGRLTDRTLYTERGKLIGTPEYMAPEQTAAGGLDVDTRADIYSLGVILYELLTGTLPFDPKTLRNASFDAMAKIIREWEPPKPSTRLSTLAEQAVNRPKGQAPENTARGQEIDFRTLRREVRGDLDWITLKALEKDRTRRYATASAFADDLARHLNPEAVLAGPASAAYHARKLLYKHRRLVAGVCAVVLALTVGLAASLVLFVQAREASRKATRTQQFLQDILSLANPYDRETKRPGYTVRELMGEAGNQTMTELANEPEVRSAIQHTIASTYLGLGLYQEAERYLLDSLATRRGILGEDHPETLNSLSLLVSLRTQQGQLAVAETLSRNLVDSLARVSGAEHRNTLSERVKLTLIISRLGRYQEAASLQVNLIEDCRRVLGQNHEITGAALASHAWVLTDLGHADQAEPYVRESLEALRQVFGDEHVRTLSVRNNLARTLALQGKFDEATPLLEANLEASVRLLDEQHPFALIALKNVGWAYTNTGRVEEAEPLLRKALEAEQTVSGLEHLETLVTAHFLALNLIGQSREVEAETLLWSTLEIRRRVAGDHHADTLWTVNELGRLLMRQKRYDEAEDLLVSSYERAAKSDSNWEFRELINNIVQLYKTRGDDTKASEWKAKLATGEP